MPLHFFLDFPVAMRTEKEVLEPIVVDQARVTRRFHQHGPDVTPDKTEKGILKRLFVVEEQDLGLSGGKTQDRQATRWITKKIARVVRGSEKLD